MRAGKLRTPLELQKRSVTKTALYESTESWPKVATVWAAITAGTGSAPVTAEGGRIEQPVQIEIRYRSDIKAIEYRLRGGNVIYELQAPPVDPDGKKARLLLTALVRQHQGDTAQVPE